MGNESLLLEKVGLSEKEATLYVTLLKQGALSYAELSNTTKINRTTCYSVIRSLIHKGLAREDIGSAVVKVLAERPSSLVEKLQKEKTVLEHKTELAKRAAFELDRLIPGKRTSEPRLTHIGETEIEDFLYKRTEKWNTSALSYDGVLWGFESAEFERDYQEYIRWFWREPSSERITIKFFSDDQHLRQTGANPKEKADFKYLPEINFTTNIWIYGDYIILLSLEEHPHYLLEMKEPLFARNFREYFKAMWKAH